MLRTAAFGLALLALVSGAAAHEFYSTYCCDGVDCAPIPAEAVKVTRQGYVVTLRPQDHLMLVNEREPRSYLVPFKAALVSPDGKFHACIYPDPSTLRCFYAPAGGF